MPKRVSVAAPTPDDVDAASYAFASQIRLHLIRFFAQEPARQADAVRALAIERQLVQSNTTALEKIGVLVRLPDRRYAADRDRVRALAEAIADFTLPQDLC